MKLYRGTTVLAVASLLALAAPQVRAGGNESEGSRGQLSKSDYKFACEAARGGMFEVRAGELARAQAASPAVKQFGEQMVADHSKANDQLKAILSKKGASVPTELDRKEQHLLQGLSKLSGTDFDRAYAENMVKDHKEDLKEFQKEAERADDPDLKNFASNTATIISGHLDHATQLNNTLEGQTTVTRQPAR
jgi:putative membrane protein